MASHSANYRGILAMIGACACFSANDALTKFAAQSLPVSEVVAIRAVFALLFAYIIVVARGEARRIHRIGDPYLMLRAFIEGFTGILVIYALSLMPLADLTAILLAQPFMMTIVGVWLLGERPGWRGWIAVTVGFIGMLLVMKPGTSAFDSASLIALVAAMFVLTRDLLTRKIPHHIPVAVVTFATALFALPIGLLGLLVEAWTMPALVPFLMTAASGGFLALGLMLMVTAFRGTDVSAVSPFRYALVVFAIIYGIILFGAIPDAVSFVGMGIIVAAGVYMLHWQTRQRRGATANAVAAMEPPH